jgi:hypothetical protein
MPRKAPRKSAARPRLSPKARGELLRRALAGVQDDGVRRWLAVLLCSGKPPDGWEVATAASRP